MISAAFLASLFSGKPLTFDPLQRTQGNAAEFFLSNSNLTGSNPGQQIGYPHGRVTTSHATGK